VKSLDQTDNFSRSVTAPDHPVAVGALMDWIEERSGRDALTAAGNRGRSIASRSKSRRKRLRNYAGLVHSILSIYRRRSC